MRQLKEAVEEAEITSDQRARMNEFFNQKALLGSEMSDEDFEKIHELGAGNGGVVSKVRHLKSGIIMARKVGVIFFDLEVPTAISYEIVENEKFGSAFEESI